MSKLRYVCTLLVRLRQLYNDDASYREIDEVIGKIEEALLDADGAVAYASLTSAIQNDLHAGRAVTVASDVSAFLNFERATEPRLDGNNVGRIVETWIHTKGATPKVLSAKDVVAKVREAFRVYQLKRRTVANTREAQGSLLSAAKFPFHALLMAISNAERYLQGDQGDHAFNSTCLGLFAVDWSLQLLSAA